MIYIPMSIDVGDNISVMIDMELLYHNKKEAVIFLLSQLQIYKLNSTSIT